MVYTETIESLRGCFGFGTCSECKAKSMMEEDPLPCKLDCKDRLGLYAADLIERLEKEKAALISTISGFCQWCKNSDADENSCRVWTGCSICDRKCPCAGCRDGSKWEWKGLEDAL
jgi:hypothetical protein